MNPSDFQDSPSGRLVPTEFSQAAFVPDPLPPRNLQFEPILGRLANAHTLLGQLQGVGRRFTNPYLLIRPLQRKEAVASSKIEGTYTTLSDLFLLEAGASEAQRPPDTREVLNYVRAMEYGFEALQDIPISTRLITNLHEVLLQGLEKRRGGQIRPGSYKEKQNYIGGTSPMNARFIPPPPQETSGLMSAFENFVNCDEAAQMPPLVLAAFAHYQFETIHPFPDGNGRVGRLLIPLILKARGVLPEPLLFVSDVVEEHKDAYINALFEVSRTGAWIPWIDLFLKIIEITCERTINSLQKLHDLNLTYLDKVQKARTSALMRGLVNYLFEWPFITIPGAARYLKITYHSAGNNIGKLVQEGILREFPGVRRPKIFYAPEIYGIVEQV